MTERRKVLTPGYGHYFVEAPMADRDAKCTCSDDVERFGLQHAESCPARPARQHPTTPTPEPVGSVGEVTAEELQSAIACFAIAGSPPDGFFMRVCRGYGELRAQYEHGLKLHGHMSRLHVYAERERDAARQEVADLRGKLERATGALTKISAIRDSIVGLQQINWSAHIYPLVAALGEAGFEGIGYEAARKEAHTLLDQRDAATSRATEAERLLTALVEGLDSLVGARGNDESHAAWEATYEALKPARAYTDRLSTLPGSKESE